MTDTSQPLQMPKRPLIYLCGPIQHQSAADIHNWREIAKMLLGKEHCVDPSRHLYPDFDGSRELSNRIVEKDIYDIGTCDGLLAYHPTPSTGTDMEIVIAHRYLKKMVFVIIPPGAPTSPWIVAHSERIYRGLSEACHAIRSVFPWN